MAISFSIHSLSSERPKKQGEQRKKEVNIKSLYYFMKNIGKLRD